MGAAGATRATPAIGELMGCGIVVSVLVVLVGVAIELLLELLLLLLLVLGVCEVMLGMARGAAVPWGSGRCTGESNPPVLFSKVTSPIQSIRWCGTAPIQGKVDLALK